MIYFFSVKECKKLCLESLNDKAPSKKALSAAEATENGRDGRKRRRRRLEGKYLLNTQDTLNKK